MTMSHHSCLVLEEISVSITKIHEQIWEEKKSHQENVRSFHYFMFPKFHGFNPSIFSASLKKNMIRINFFSKCDTAKAYSNTNTDMIPTNSTWLSYRATARKKQKYIRAWEVRGSSSTQTSAIIELLMLFLQVLELF